MYQLVFFLCTTSLCNDPYFPACDEGKNDITSALKLPIYTGMKQIPIWGNIFRHPSCLDHGLLGYDTLHFIHLSWFI
jgi:hypothetical protein